jgi:hypothetical protein
MRARQSLEPDPVWDRASGQTTPLSCERSSQAATVRVHRESTMSSTSSRGSQRTRPGTHLGHVDEQLAQGSEQAGVGGRVAARGAADGEGWS